MTVLDLLTAALQEIGVAAPDEDLAPHDQAFALQKFNRIVDNWNAQREAVYADVFLTETLTPSLQPHTIGPSGATWTVTQRPVSIEGVELILSAGDRLTLWPRSAAWWQALPLPALASTIPSDFFYDATWPKGSLYLWPVPSTNYTVQLHVRTVLTEYTLETALSLPPGYRDALILTLAEDCASAFGKTMGPQGTLNASKARARIFANNVAVPKLVTLDAGMPSGRSGWWDYRIGQ